MFHTLFSAKKPLIGMIHLPALPGYPTHPGMDEVTKKAVADLQTLQSAGFDGALVENDNDQPHQIGASRSTIQAFEVVMKALLAKATIPVGMEIIYDMPQTIKVAHKVGVPFVRLDVFVDDVVTEWGRIYGQAKELMALKDTLGARDLVLLTDIHVKHAKMLSSKSLSDSAREAFKHGSDALIITGDWTGLPPSMQDCKTAKRAANCPVLIGSGLNAANAKQLLGFADGAIVGSSIKTGAYIDADKAKALLHELRV
ncbi:MAG TPA: BtpA/SgcQ family protein [Patescibacteria group bacterium]|nr:BtpA/SgcQ family protein [Patescibacteria group bacterium]